MKKLKQIVQNFRVFLTTTTIFGVALDNILIKSFYAATLICALVWMLPSERPSEYSNLTVGSISTEEIIAPFKFPIQKTDQELSREREAAWKNVPPLFILDSTAQIARLITLNSFFSDLETYLGSLEITPEMSEPGFQPETIRAQQDSFLNAFNLKYSTRLNASVLAKLEVVNTSGQLKTLQQNLQSGISYVYGRGIINRSKSDIIEERLIVVRSGVESDSAVKSVFDEQEARREIYNRLVQANQNLGLQLDAADNFISAFVKPNLNYDGVVSVTRKQQAIHEVPLARGFVEQDERIIDSNEKVTSDIHQKLVSLSIAQQERSALQGRWEQVKFLTGKTLFAVTLLLLTILYIFFYRRDTFSDNGRLAMITLVFVLEFAAIELVHGVLLWPSISIPMILAPMLLCMLLDFGIAFICNVSLSLIIGSVLGNDYTLTFTCLIVGSVAIFSVQKIRNRNHIFRAILFIMAAYFLVNLMFGLLLFTPLPEILRNFSFYMVPNALLVPAIVFILIGMFERYFDVTTDITLLELSDLNHPLLKRLSVEAPGSFHHSSVVANLAESAAIGISANALLARVGCYFHDIGKMLKPEYFVENQMGGVNKHDGLSPHMSSLILANHVKEGLKLADKHGLPRAVRQFIAEHHGTSLMAYFYHKAQESMDPKTLNEDDFRYPGPKPQSKETAISMMADTVEAASRTLQEPTPQRIRNLVDQLIDKKIEEGQLDNCNLTFGEINTIKESFIPILTGIHHLRIEYPEPDGRGASKEDGTNGADRAGSRSGSRKKSGENDTAQRDSGRKKSSHAGSN